MFGDIIQGNGGLEVLSNKRNCVFYPFVGNRVCLFVILYRKIGAEQPHQPQYRIANVRSAADVGRGVPVKSGNNIQILTANFVITDQFLKVQRGNGNAVRFKVGIVDDQAVIADQTVAAKGMGNIGVHHKQVPFGKIVNLRAAVDAAITFITEEQASHGFHSSNSS